MYKYISVFLIFLILSVDIAFAQCSMCRAVLNSSEAQETAKGINNGILFLNYTTGCFKDNNLIFRLVRFYQVLIEIVDGHTRIEHYSLRVDTT